jgi:serine/threonine protein kinase
MFLRNAPDIIDPTNLSSTQQKQLVTLMMQRPLMRYFEKGINYAYDSKKKLSRHSGKRYLQLTSGIIHIRQKMGDVFAVIDEEYEVAEGVHAFLLKGYLHQDESTLHFQALKYHYYIHCDKPIPLLCMTQQQSKFLFALMMQAIRENRSLHEFKQGQSVFYLKDHEHRYYTVYLNIDHDILVRKRESNTDELRFEVSDNHASFLGVGGYGRVYKTSATLIPLSNGALKLKLAERVIKESLVCNEYSRKNILHEHTMSSLTPHLHPKRMIQQLGDHPKLWMVSRYLPGVNMRDYINRLRQQPITPEAIRHMVDLSYELVRCVFRQGFKLDILHCDIKPSNLQLDTASAKYPHINLLDYGLSRCAGLKIKRCGTGLYAAPEVWVAQKHITSSFSMDIYSLGMTLMTMWGILDLDQLYNHRLGIKALADESIRKILMANMSALYGCIDPALQNVSEMFINIIFSMIREPPPSRITFEMAIRHMAEFRQSYYAGYYSAGDSGRYQRYHSLLQSAYTYAGCLSSMLPALLRCDCQSDKFTNTLNECRRIFGYLYDHVHIIEGFLFMLGERCLQTEHNKAGLCKKLDRILNDYHEVRKKHLLSLAYLKQIVLLDEFLLLQDEYQEHLCRLFKSCKTHAASVPESLDDVVTLSAILARDIHKMEQDFMLLTITDMSVMTSIVPVRPWRQSYAPMTLGELCRAAPSSIKNIDIKF